MTSETQKFKVGDLVTPNYRGKHEGSLEWIGEAIVTNVPPDNGSWVHIEVVEMAQPHPWNSVGDNLIAHVPYLKLSRVLKKDVDAAIKSIMNRP